MNDRYLIDTNVISEHIRKLPNVDVLSWWSQLPATSMFTTVLNIGELKYGALSLPLDHPKRQKLLNWLEQDISNWFDQRVFSITPDIAEKWAEIKSKQLKIPEIDAIIAATCLVHNCILVTRNEKDFKSIHHLKILNPFIVIEDEKEEYLEAKAILESNDPTYTMEEAEALLGLAGKI